MLIGGLGQRRSLMTPSTNESCCPKSGPERREARSGAFGLTAPLRAFRRIVAVRRLGVGGAGTEVAHGAQRRLWRRSKRYGSPKVIVTDRLRSYKAAMKEIGNAERQVTGRHLNNRAENSHQPFRRRERAMLRFRRMKTLQKFASVHAQVHNHFNQERSIVDRQSYKERRSEALSEWRSVMA